MRWIIFLTLVFFACCVSNNPDSLSPEEISALDRALDDEYKARATYKQVVSDFGEVRPFTNILAAEEQHIAALEALYSRYGLEVPEDQWPSKAPSYSSLSAACEAGVDAEIANAALYDELLPVVEHDDVRTAFMSLRDASRNNHLPAFQRCS